MQNKALDVQEVKLCEMDLGAFGKTCRDMFEKGYAWSGLINKNKNGDKLEFVAKFFKYAGPKELAVNVQEINIESIVN